MKNDLELITPFKRVCVTIGNLPTAYLESMSYYECLTYLVKFLTNEVIPVVNNNSEVVKELQEYVNHYFDNLDVQEEINNKLDEMAESGQLADIIAQYISLAGILAFDTKADLKEALNIADGSICKTLGETDYTDGKGALYKIRTVVAGDVVDEDNIISLDISNTLIGEKIPYSSNYKLQEQIDNINNNRTIILSDSYFDWSPDETIPVENRWYSLFYKAEKITEHQEWNDGGIGFVHVGGVTQLNIKGLLQSHENDVSNKDTVKNIIVLCGYNDADSTISLNDIKAKVKEFANYCHTTYPNATVYIGQIGFDSNRSSQGSDKRYALNSKVTPGYASAIQDVSSDTFIYLPNLNYCLHNTDYMSTDGIHPNGAGHIQIANALYNSFHNCFVSYQQTDEYVTLTSYDADHTLTSNLLVRNVIPTKNISIQRFLLDTSSDPITLGNNFKTLATFNNNSKTMFPNYGIDFLVQLLVNTSDNGFYLLPASLRFLDTGELQVSLNAINDNRDGFITVNNVIYVQIMACELSIDLNMM